MRDPHEEQILLRAVDAFRRRLIVVSPDFEILASNCPVDELCGQDIVGKRCHQVFYESESPCRNCAVKEVLETGRPSLRPKPGNGVDISKMPCYYSYAIRDGDRVAALVSMDFDLPTRSGIEERLQQTNAFLRNLILSAVDGVIAADRSGNILIFNEAAAQVFGYTEQEALDTLNSRDIYPDGLAHEVMRRMRSDDHGGPGKLKSYQVDVLSRDGERIPISLSAAIVYEEGREVATIGFFHDLRETLRMREELEKTQLQLLQAEKMASLGKLAAGVAHQINNPLGGITLYAKLIMEENELDDSVTEDLQRILKDAERCRDTVKELLEFTRQTRHLVRDHDINAALARTMFLLENQTLFHNIDIRKELDKSLPAVPVDIQQVNHVFMNVILNAAQAMEGRGVLTLRSRMGEREDRVIVEISDTGPGIPPEVMPHIFDPFYTTKEEGKGTGLGLSLAYGIMENHGGSIRAESEPGKGTTLIIELPVRAEGSENAGDE